MYASLVAKVPHPSRLIPLALGAALAAGCDSGGIVSHTDGGNGDGGQSDGGMGDGKGGSGGSGGMGGMGGAGGGMGGTGGGPPPSGFTDPMCTDGKYTETLPDPSASLADLTFSGDIPALVDASLMRRYPFGLEEVKGGRMDTRFGDCSVVFAGSPKSAADVYDRLEVIVHECGHINDGRLGMLPDNSYVINPKLTFACPRGDSTARGGDTFARSLLNGDDYASLRPRCSSGKKPCDFYADTYLDGDPTDGKFDGGDQGFNMLFEEVVQYVNSLATSYAFADRISSGGRVSSKDGILTFLWYLERYLHLARTRYPAAYTSISGATCWRDAILTVWGRAWLYLETTRARSALGIDDAVLEMLVKEPVLLDEIERIRTAAGCP